MIAITTGSSDWTDYKLIWEVLDETYEETIARQKKMTANQRKQFPKEHGLTLYNGECDTGADLFILQWFENAQAEGMEVYFHGFPADWKNCSSICPPPFAKGYMNHRRRGRYGNYCPSAGIQRNIDMVETAEAYVHQYCFQSLCLAFCLNDSPGTVQCARLAKRRGFQLRPHRLGTQIKKL